MRDLVSPVLQILHDSFPAMHTDSRHAVPIKNRFSSMVIITNLEPPFWDWKESTIYIMSGQKPNNIAKEAAFQLVAGGAAGK